MRMSVDLPFDEAKRLAWRHNEAYHNSVSIARVLPDGEYARRIKMRYAVVCLACTSPWRTEQKKE